MTLRLLQTLGAFHTSDKNAVIFRLVQQNLALLQFWHLPAMKSKLGWVWIKDSRDDVDTSIYSLGQRTKISSTSDRIFDKFHLEYHEKFWILVSVNKIFILHPQFFPIVLKCPKIAGAKAPMLNTPLNIIANEPGYHNGQVQLLFASIDSVQLPILNIWQSRSFEVLN